MYLFLVVALVAQHPNPGHHFSEFAKVFDSGAIEYVGFAADKALEKMVGLKELEPLDTTNVQAAADRIARSAQHVLLDVGPPFSLSLAEALIERNIKVIAYVDNYEGCNALASRIVAVADHAIYAKELGYYPLEDIEKIKTLRSSLAFKKNFLLDHNLNPELPVLLFIGSAHKTYENAFKTFLSENKETLSHYNLLLHRHPRADEQQISDKIDLYNARLDTHFAVSHGTFDEVMGVADVIGYEQTTTAVKGPLLGIPTFQWGTALKTNQDLQAFLDSPSQITSLQALETVGYKPDWKNRLIKEIENL